MGENRLWGRQRGDRDGYQTGNVSVDASEGREAFKRGVKYGMANGVTIDNE